MKCIFQIGNMNDIIEENIETESLFCMVNFEDYDVVITAKDFRGMDWKR